METLRMSVLNRSNRILIRMTITCMMLSGVTLEALASPDEWLFQMRNGALSSWNFYGESLEGESGPEGLSGPAVALSCLPQVNISLGQQGYAVITALTLVNAPEYPANQYIVDIMGPLTNTVYCAQLGQQLMVLVTEIPTNNSCMSSIFIEDKLKPVLVCTSDTLPCNVDIESIDFENYLESVTDNCDSNPSIWYSYVVQNLPCNPHHFTQQILVTWTATDDSGNSATCQDIIYLRKPALGQIVFPPNISLNCVNANINPSNTGVPTFNGEPLAAACQYSVNYTDQVIPMCPGAQKILRTWKIVDWCTSGQITRVQEILIVDNVPPVIICPVNITISAGIAVCSANYTLPTPVVSDACAPTNLIDIDIFVNGVPGIFSPGQIVTLGVGTTLIRIRATDPCGNSSQCMYNVTVRDNTPPILVCPPNITVDCTSSTDPAFTGSATATDNCDPSPDVTYTDVTAETQGCAFGYKITRTWRAIDNSGNSITCMQMILFTDNTPPTISCPGNVTIECTASTAPSNTGSATASDLCDNSPTITFTDITAGGACPQQYTISRTWRATDDCGNTSTCIQVIMVDDNTPPAITCPPDITIMCDESTEPAITGLPTATDNCDPTSTFTFSDQIVPGALQTFIINRTWIATDDCSNSSTCIQLILVRDETPPVITCPDNITVQCTDSTLPESTGSATATDNCDPEPVITFNDITAGGPCPQELTITRTWTATDACGNTSTCIQTIEVDDSIAPAITCPSDVTIECTASTMPVNTGTASATDTCDSTPEIAYSDATAGGLCPQEMTITRTWTATDDCGNVSTCMQIIVVDDSVAPVISCPLNVTIECSESTLPMNTGSAAATDNCDSSPALDFSDDIAGGTCPQELTITRTWVATDDCGNSSTCVQTIVVNDNLPPVISCPVNITIECTESTLPVNTGTASATDNCDDLPAIGFSDITVGGSCPQELTITRTWTASDECGNSSTCVQTIVVEDSVAPAMTCPSNITIECNSSTDPDDTGSATATDACDLTPTIIFTDEIVGGSCPQESVITRTWRATDDCDNSSTCIQIIVIDDSLAPVITCPDNVTIECIDSTFPQNTGLPGATDNCDTNPSLDFSDITTEGDCSAEYTIIRTWVAIDDCGNSSTCNQTIAIEDNIAPIIACPADVTIECTESTLPINTGSATASDICDSTPAITFSDITAAGICPQEITITRTWIAEDNCGNTSSCIQTIVTEDNTPPVITCPANLTLDCSGSTLPEDTGSASATDNCSTFPEVTFSDVTVGGVCPLLLTITRTWTASDGCGNSSTCVQIIVLTDATAPDILCPANVTIECNESTLPDNTGSATATDFCDNDPALTFSDVTVGGGCPEESTITRTWVATDDCGNTSSCIQTISVQDSQAPVLSCPVNVTIECNESTLPENTGTATSTDNCDETPTLSFSDVTAGAGCPDGYTITRTWTAIDNCGNAGTCEQIIVVDDGTAPLVSCPANVTIECTASTAPANTGTATASDNCDDSPIVAFNDVTVGGACPQEYTITRTWSATDQCGNTGTCNQTIVVEDSTPPVCIAVNITVSINGNGMVSISGADIDGGSTDNCGPVTLEVVPNTFDCTNLGENPVVLTVTDCPGNSSTCTAIVTVLDDGGLEAICQNVTIFVDANGNASVDPEDINNGSGGGCQPGILEFDLSQTDFNCDNLGPNIVILTVTDENGNTATCTAIVTVDDLIPPVITCPANLTVDCHTVLDPENTGQFGNATATDNCPGTFIVETHVINLNDCNVGTIVRTFTATDASGNTATCVQTITVANPNPLGENDIDWPNSPVNVNICNSTDPDDIPNGEPVIDPIALLCADPVITFVDQVQTIIDNNPNTPCKIITRTWTVVDNCQPNGTFVFVQTINVTDAVPPLFTNINDMTKMANSNCVAPFTIIASATDCAGVSITNNSPYGANTGANASGNYPIGVTVVLFTATDGCGNISTMDVVITVIDPDPTTMNCEKTIIFLPPETEITLKPDTFVTFVQGNCTTPNDVIVSYSGTNPFDTLRTYDCGDVGVSTFSLWLWNAAGTMILDTCNTADLDLRDPDDFCQDGLVLFGNVENENGLDVSGVEVSITNESMIPDTTNLQGQYLLGGLTEGTGYNVAPFDDQYHREGVSTLDLVLIQKHLLGKAKLNSPYKMIAADANKSGHLTAIDLLEIRKLILGINNRFPNNTSWRFVDREFSFVDPFNPFTPAFPESIWVDSVTGGADTANFVAIKIGDVNGSYFLGRASGEEIKPRADLSYGLNIMRLVDQKDNQMKLVVMAMPDQGSLDGMQFSFFAGGLSNEQVMRITSDILTEDQWYYNPETHHIYVSWSSGIEVDLTGKIMLSVPDIGEPMEMVTMKSSLIEAEAYRVDEQEVSILQIYLSGSAIEVATVNEYQLFQNIPNPFSETTSIRFSLPKDELVTLVIHDMAGRKVYSKEARGLAGINEMAIRKQDLGSSGIYYYTLYTLNASFTHKMSFTKN